MLTNSTFNKSRNVSGAVNNTIIKLYDGTNYYYFSEVDMQFGTIHVYPVLLSHSGIIERVNIFQKDWAVSEVAIELSNVPYKINDSGNWIRPSDELQNIRGQAVSIYLLAGSNVSTFPDHCLERFKGYVASAPEYNNDVLRITLIDKGKIYVKTLPTNIVGDIYSDAVSPFKEQKIPIVYGEFSLIGKQGEDFDYTGLGLAIAIPIESATPPKCVVSDHILHTLSTANIYLIVSDVADPLIYSTGSVNTNDSGKGTFTGNTEAYAYIYSYDSRDDDDNFRTSGYADPTNYLNAIDRNDSSWASVLDSIDLGNNDQTIGYALYGISNASFFNSQIPTGSVSTTDETCTALYIETKIQSFIPNWDSLKITLVDIQNDNLTLTDFEPSGTASWEISPDLKGDMGGTYPDADGILILVQKDVDSDGDGVVDNRTVIRLWEVRIRMKYKPRDHSKPFVGCKGRKYDTWINGRSSSYSSTELIEDPAGIIESILRDYLGLANADIDLTTFIDAENTSVKARINLHSRNELETDILIRRICEQATFAYVFSAAGKARLIELNNSSPSTDRTIPFSHIVEDSLSIGKSKWIVNKIESRSRLQQEYRNILRDIDTYNNTTKQATWQGTRKYNAKWPNLAGTSADHIANHLIRSADGSASDGNGIWANEHEVIDFKTVGFTNADLEVGDWIELDDADMDAQIELYGATWSGKQFLIIELQQYMNETRIKAIKLY